MRRLIQAAALAAVLAAGGLAAAPASAATAPAPPMGWNDWYDFHCGISEEVVLAEARALISTGLAAAGYHYVDIDDCWMASRRTSTGSLTWNPTKFPDGIPALAARLHRMGLKLGIYDSIGTITCQRFPGSWDHLRHDAATFASWGVDLVKMDSCGLPKGTTLATETMWFQRFGNFLQADNPAIVYSQELPHQLNGSAFTSAVQASAQWSNMWRISLDESGAQPSSTTIIGHLVRDLPLARYARPGHWNDLDMLVTGVPIFPWTFKAQFSQIEVWAEMASPMLISTVASLTSGQVAALGNRHLIAIDQSGAQGRLAGTSGPVDVVTKADPLGGRAVLLANTGTRRRTAHVTLAEVGLSGASGHALNLYTGGRFAVGRRWTYPLRAGQLALLQITP